MTVESQYILAIVAGLVIGGYLHEASHWFVGWLGDTDPKMEWVFRIFPNGVDHGKMETMDPALIRLSGASIFLWMPPGFLALAFLPFNVNPGTVFVAAVPVSILIAATESDAIAIRNPEKFRRMWLNDEFQRNPLFIPNWLMPDWLPRF